MNDEELWHAFWIEFRYGRPSELPFDAIDRLRSKLHNDQWSVHRVVREFESFYERLSPPERDHIRSSRTALIDLKKMEQKQAKELRRDMDAAFDASVSTESVVQATGLIPTYLAKVNRGQRATIAKELIEDLDDLETELRESSYDVADLRAAIEQGSDEDIVEELRRIYQHFYQKGWHRRDIGEIVNVHAEGEELFDRLEKIVEQEINEYTYAFFVPNLEIEERIKPDGFVHKVIPQGELASDEIETIYPYDDVDEVDVHRVDELEKILDTTTTVTVPVESYGLYGAKEQAINRLIAFLDAFAWTAVAGRIEDPHFGEELKYLRFTPNGLEDAGIGWTTEPEEPLIFEEEHSELLAEDVLPLMEQDTPLAQRFQRGLHLYRKARASYRDIDTIINYIACLETIVSPAQTNQRETIRNALLVGKMWDTDENWDRLTRIFDLRNATLHAGDIQRNIDGDALMMRNILNPALHELFQCLTETGRTTREEFLEYVGEKTTKIFQEQLMELRRNSIDVNREYSFEGVVVDEDAQLATLEGAVEFVYDDQLIMPRIVVERAEKTEDERFPSQVNIPIETEIVGTPIRLKGIRVNPREGNSINLDYFRYIAPWEAIGREFEIMT